MSDTYRGFPHPEIIEVDGWFWIVDPKFGEHWGYDPSVTLTSWMNKVDTVIVQDAIEMDLLERSGIHDLLSCRECGLLVGDTFKHLDWHRTH